MKWKRRGPGWYTAVGSSGTDYRIVQPDEGGWRLIGNEYVVAECAKLAEAKQAAVDHEGFLERQVLASRGD